MARFAQNHSVVYFRFATGGVMVYVVGININIHRTCTTLLALEARDS
jgi:hypothetical protein